MYPFNLCSFLVLVLLNMYLVCVFRLQCEPSQLKSTNWSSWPSLECSSNVIPSTDSCNRTTCAYTGYYTFRNISAEVVTENTTCAGQCATNDFNFLLTCIKFERQNWFISIYMYMVNEITDRQLMICLVVSDCVQTVPPSGSGGSTGSDSGASRSTFQGLLLSNLLIVIHFVLFLVYVLQ